MPYPRKDISGQRFGRLTAIQVVGTDKYRSPLWLCSCDCGGSIVAPTHNILKKTRSCGCGRRELCGLLNRKHSGSQTSEYRCWKSMRQRCLNPRSKDWLLYGGRGISICARWLVGDGTRSGFECFLDDMGPRPSRRHSIDRFPDNDGNYEPGNCRWATPVEQANNKRKWGTA